MTQAVTAYSPQQLRAKQLLQPLPSEPFAFFQCGTRTVHPNGHVEVAGAFYPVPLHLLGADVQVRWDARLIRVFHDAIAIAVHAPVTPGGVRAPWGWTPGAQLQSSQQAFVDAAGRPAVRRWRPGRSADP